NDPGTNALFAALLAELGIDVPQDLDTGAPDRGTIIPPERIRYLSEITATNRRYDAWVREQSTVAAELHQLRGAIALLAERGGQEAALEGLRSVLAEKERQLDPRCRELLAGWDDLVAAYAQDTYTYEVRGRSIEVPQASRSLSGLRVPKV